MADLTVTLTEALTLNSATIGGTNTKVVSGINEVDKRIVTITTNESTIMTMSGAVASAGHYNDSAVRYMRFTNLDASNHITLTFRNQDNDETAILLDAGNSFMWFADNNNGMVGVLNATQDADAASDTNLGSITNIQADANSGSCKLEILVATT